MLAWRSEGKTKPLEAKHWWSLIQVFGRQKQVDLCEFKVNLAYRRLMQKQIKVVVAHTFNPNTRESHAFNPSTKEYKTLETEAQSSVSSRPALVEVRLL